MAATALPEPRRRAGQVNTHDFVTYPRHESVVYSWAAKTQGLKACIERYQQSPVMHKNIPDECKPVVLENGVSPPDLPFLKF